MTQEDISPKGKQALSFDELEAQTINMSKYETKLKQELYKDVLEAQREIFMSQYDMEWGEIKQNTT